MDGVNENIDKSEKELRKLKAAIEKIKEIRTLFNSLIPHPSELVIKQNPSPENQSMMEIELVESKIVPDRL